MNVNRGLWITMAAACAFVAGAPDGGATAAGAARDLDAQGHRASVTFQAAAEAPVPRAERGTAIWTSLGPPGGDVADVAESTTAAGVVLAGLAPSSGGGGLYRSTDGGDTWTQLASPSGINVYDIEFAADGTAYIGTNAGPMRSSDDGLTWTPLNLGIGANQVVLDVALDPSNVQTLWVGIADGFGLQPVNIMRSTDGGNVWTNRTPPLAAPINGTGIAVDPADPDTVVAVFGGSFGGGAVWVTSNGGDTWTDRSAGLPANPMRTVVHDGSRFLVGGGQLFGSQYVGLYATPDLGVTWTPLHDGTWPLRVVEAIAIDPADPDVILAAINGRGVNRSIDGGATWEIGIGGTQQFASQSLRFAPGSSTVLYLGATSLGVFRSDNGGDTFAAASDGISALDIFSVHANPTNPSQLAAAFQGDNNGGVFRSTDGGANWTLESAPPTRYSVVRFAADGTLYAVSTGPTTVATEGLYRRESDGEWTPLGPNQGPLFESELQALEFAPDDQSVILMGGGDFGVAGDEATVWRSGDAGATWEKRYEAQPGDDVTDIEMDAAAGAAVASFDGFTAPQEGGALRSVDGGLNWSPASTGLPAFARGPRVCLAADGTFILSAWLTFDSGGVFRSVDDGASWQAAGWTGPRIVDVACDPADAQRLHIAQASADIVLRSDDQGTSFSPYSAGLETAGGARALSQVGTRLFLATTSGSFATAPEDLIFADGFELPD